MPESLWHTVPMAAIVKNSMSPPLTAAFHVDLSAVEAGISLATFAGFLKALGEPAKDVQEIVIPARTLKHRRARKEALSLEESDRLARVVRVFDFAIRIFGDAKRAGSWMNKPKRRFDGRTPIAMLRTDLGGRQVEEMLIQIDEGMFA